MIYFDNSATTKPFEEVIQSFTTVATEYYGNPSSLHGLGAEAEKLMTRAREQIAQLIRVKPREIVFTSGGTESNNLAIKGTALALQSRGKHIITSSVEHASVKQAFKQLEELGFNVTYLPVSKEGLVEIDTLEQAIRDDTILISLIHVQNEVGAIQPIEEAGRLLKQYPKIQFHVDHVQGVGKVPLPLDKWNVDLCSFSAHKFNGLKGTGFLFVREGTVLWPLLSGGSQEGTLRSGTENVAGFVAMAKALRLTLQKDISPLVQLKEYLLDELKKIDQVVIHTPREGSAPHILNFSLIGLKGEVLVHALESHDIYVSTTSACSSKKKAHSETLEAMGVPEQVASGALRISLSWHNTLEEGKIFIQALKQSLAMLNKTMRR
ncbi:MAG TPA: cysteine desulfurase family protein [Bacillus sp. (in: firmicutes)]|uniref:cysteine desulfurase family protein n=1 Tax=Bacillus litorisediminis TaxID=2922713 RepID=UPI001FAD5192|nr:cysteine desulfurase family protein [Bacillus litorisediminis]HWO75469.1 cysteine desulfurase family protein [Bacillus sp. (in: firmicutes)]